MSTFLWRLKERASTFLTSSSLFNSLIDSVFKKLNPADVFFVEIGANDGIQGDHIYNYVMQRGWKGVYVEPQKKVFTRLKDNFKGVDGLFFENIAITKQEEELTLYIPAGEDPGSTVLASLSPDNAALTHFDKSQLTEETVQGKPFAYLVEKYMLKDKKCVVLMLDVEGFEQQILTSIDFSDYKPQFILFEHKHMSYSLHGTLNEMLQHNGYKVYTERHDSLACLAE
jgi:FkbM family methyltransferase